MKIDIPQAVDSLCNQFDSRNPFEITEQLKIIVLCEPLGKIQGYYNEQYGGKCCISIPTCQQEIREWYVPTNWVMRFFIQNRILHFCAHNSIDKMEKEANRFMVYLEIMDNEQFEKLLFDILSGYWDSNIRFKDLQSILEACGFVCRIKGDHFIYTKNGVQEILNIQPNGNKAKPYQVKQVRNIITKYRLGEQFDE